jgi:predicted Zn-dependent protease
MTGKMLHIGSRGTFMGIVLLSGCAYVEPFVQEINIVSVSEEEQIGESLAREIATELVFVEDRRVIHRIHTMGQRLLEGLPYRDFTYRFNVVRDETPNAFTIPGGRIYVHTGLIDFAKDDSEIAGVLAHEIGHAFERHPAKAISRAYGIDTLGRLLLKDPQSRFRTVALELAKGGFLARYGREDEYRADEISHLLVKKAGYPTDGLLRFLERLQSRQQGGFSIPFFRSHPPTPDRIARLKSFEQKY